MDTKKKNKMERQEYAVVVVFDHGPGQYPVKALTRQRRERYGGSVPSWQGERGSSEHKQM